MKMNYTKIYSKCIDFDKNVMLQKEKQLFFQEQKQYHICKNDDELMIKKEHYENKLIKTIQKINSIYLLDEKANKKYCLYDFKVQEKLRSQYYFYLNSVNCINAVLKKTRVFKENIDES